MSIDWSQIYQIFFEENSELIAEIEECLLFLKSDNYDKEKINEVFRAIHTIKGNSGVVNFTEVIEFLHVIETYLDHIREGTHNLNEESLSLLLSSVDALRKAMLEKKEQHKVDVAQLDVLKNNFLALLSQAPNSNSIAQIPPASQKSKITHVSKYPDPSSEPNLEISTIRIDIEKIDTLINMVGDIIVEQLTLKKLFYKLKLDAVQTKELIDHLDELQKYYRFLQESVLRIRMLPLKFAFNRFQRMIHDLSTRLNKKVKLTIRGEETEIDKVIIEKISDPLTHLLRNAVSHGIETPLIREENGKSPIGHISINAYEQQGRVIIEIEDDGTGLDKDKIIKTALQKKIINNVDELSESQIYDLIYEPGFSTAEETSDISGRGVGMDVVLKNIQELGGIIEIDSRIGLGTKFILKLPLTVSIMDSQLLKIDSDTFLIPLVNIIALIQIQENFLDLNEEGVFFYLYKNEYIPIFHLSELLQKKPVTTDEIYNKYLIVTEVNKKHYGIIVDKVYENQSIFIKNIDEDFKKIFGILGITILEDGQVVPILDVASLISLALTKDVKKFMKMNMPRTSNFVLNKPTFSNINWSEGKFQALSFKIQQKEYLLATSDIMEIIPYEKPTPLPYTKNYLIGLINQRGHVYPIIDLCKKFHLGENSNNPTKIILVSAKGSNHNIGTIGIEIEELGKIEWISEQELKPLPDIEKSQLNNYIIGLVSMNNKFATLIDAKNLVLMVKK